MPESAPACLVCSRGEQEIPLVQLAYRGERLHICPQHLPVLIHDPQRVFRDTSWRRQCKCVAETLECLDRAGVYRRPQTPIW